MAATVPRQKRNFPAFKRAQNVHIGRIAKRSLLTELAYSSQPGHCVESAAADDPNFRL